MIKQNKKKIIISSIITLLPAFASLILWNLLPDQMAVQWSFDSSVQGWKQKSFVVFALPALMLLLHWICIFICSIDPGNRYQNRHIFNMIYWICPITSILSGAAIYYAAFGQPFNISMLLSIGLGLMFIFVGNYFPKCRYNHTIGIRVPWTLLSEENWDKTHKIGGKLWVAGGFLMVISAFLPEKIAGFLQQAAVLILIIILPILYSYLYYRKQKKLGTYTAPGSNSEEVRRNSRITKYSLIFTVICFIFAGFLLFTGDLEMQYDDDSFTIVASYYPDMTVSYDSIESMELRQEKIDGSRTNGWGSMRLLMGAFHNSEFGPYTRYTYTNCSSAIILDLDGRTLVLSGKNEAGTEDIYQELLKRTGR